MKEHLLPLGRPLLQALKLSASLDISSSSQDPFHTLDIDGVGELLKIGVTRARGVKSDIVLSICGEHGGSPESIDFCRKIGMDYVSCSPFRVPIAKLAAAQLAIKDRIEPSP